MKNSHLIEICAAHFGTDGTYDNAVAMVRALRALPEFNKRFNIISVSDARNWHFDNHSLEIEFSRFWDNELDAVLDA